ncbi:T9SS type A sorting domain-containing protein [bacterium]|nr:T9SS type A sorting domain-containing protein [bacterium]
MTEVEREWDSRGKSDAVSINEWTHVAITVNVDSARCYVYINGVGNRLNWDDTLEKDYNTQGYPLRLGGFSANIDSTLYLNGLLDDLRIWNVERSSAQIQSCMNDRLLPLYYLHADSGLVLYYRFDELENLGIGDDGLVDDIRDFSVYKNHGDIVGNAKLVMSNVTHVDPEPADVPIAFNLLQNYPNPFNASTTIRFQLSQKSPVRLSIFNILGEEIETLIDDVMDQGVHDIVWNAEGYPSGIYFSRLQTGEDIETVKMLLQR